MLAGLLDSFADPEDDAAAREALAALQVAVTSAGVMSHVAGAFRRLSVQQKCALLDILRENSGEVDPGVAPVVAALFKEQSAALLTTFRSDAGEADPSVTVKVRIGVKSDRST